MWMNFKMCRFWAHFCDWYLEYFNILGHQQPWYWLYRINGCLSSTRKDFNYLRHLKSAEMIENVLSWCLIFKLSLCDSFEDQAPVDFIYGCPIFKWIAQTWPDDRVPGYQPKQWLLCDRPCCFIEKSTRWIVAWNPPNPTISYQYHWWLPPLSPHLSFPHSP